MSNLYSCSLCKKSHPEGELCGIVKDIGDICNGILEDDTDASTGLDRIRGIVQIVKDNDNLNYLAEQHLDFSGCTRQTKGMADTNGPMGPCPTLSSRLLDILALMIMYGSDYERGNTTDHHNDKMTAMFLYLEGVVDIGIDSFFPTVMIGRDDEEEGGDDDGEGLDDEEEGGDDDGEGGDDDGEGGDEDDGGEKHYSFLDGCLFPILKQGMPSAMKHLVNAASTYFTLGRDEVLMDQLITELYVVGYHDGDGSGSGVFSGRRIPSESLAIKSATYPNALSEFLKTNTNFHQNGASISRYANYGTMVERPWFMANMESRTLKRAQFFTMLKFAKGGNFVQTSTTTTQSVVTAPVRKARTEAAVILAHLNDNHGVGTPVEWYKERFNAMMRSTHSPLSFHLYAAGMLGADGNVGDMLTRCHLIQSNQAYCEAFASAVQHTCNLPSTPRVGNLSSDVNHSVNTRAPFRVYFGVDAAVPMILYFGSFDYGRRLQWLVFLIGVLIKQSKPFPNQSKVKCFLEDLIKVIRLECPS